MNVNRTVETEAKYSISQSDTFERILNIEAIGSYKRGDQTIKRVHDTYVDTIEHHFYNNQLYVRLRKKEGGADDDLLLTIKRLGQPAQGAVHARDEYECRVSGREIAAWPEGEARSIAEEVAGGRPFVDLVTVDQVRHVASLYDGDRAIAEMSLDKITVYSAHGPVETHELEIELLPDGTRGDLDAIARQLESEGGLTPQPLSKFERAMQLNTGEEEAVVPDPTSRGETAAELISGNEKGKGKDKGKEKASKAIEPADDIGQAARKLLSRYADAMLKNEEGTKKGEDPEALHDMRVATRRIRATLRLVAPYLDQTDKLNRDVRAVTRALGGVRDLDVLLEQARAFQETLPEDQRADMDGLIGEWTAERKKLRKRLLRALSSNAYRRLKRRMDRFLNEEQKQKATRAEVVEPREVRHIAGSAIWTHYEAVRAYETVMDAPTIEQLHALRIEGKYLRYTLESFRDALPPEASDLIRDVTAMQDMLGEMHDADVAAALVRAFADKGRKKRKGDGESTTPPGLTAYLSDREETVQRIVSSFGPDWQKIGGPEWRAQLAQVIAGI